MLINTYPFLSVVLNEKLPSTSNTKRWSTIPESVRFNWNPSNELEHKSATSFLQENSMYSATFISSQIYEITWTKIRQVILPILGKIITILMQMLYLQGLAYHTCQQKNMLLPDTQNICTKYY